MLQRHPSRYKEKQKGGCISGLMRMFDFRHARSTKRLLPSKQVVGCQHSSSIDSSDLEIIMQELAKLSPKISQNLDNDIPSDHILNVLEDKLGTAVDLFIEHKLSKKEFIDAQHTLSSKRDLFLKLLEKNTKCCSSPAFRYRKLFHTRSKSVSSYNSRRDKDFHQCYFSFSRIKRKLRQTIGKRKEITFHAGWILKFLSRSQSGNSVMYTETYAKSSTSSSEIQPLGVCMSFDDEEAAFEYLFVEAILLGSGLNWDEVLLRWICLYEILEESLFDEVELFSGRPHYDKKLLFDCANEVLKEVCEVYFGCFLKCSIHYYELSSVDIVNAVWERVEYRLYQYQYRMFHSVDELVKTDMGIRNWIDHNSDIEVVCFEMEESIFDELVLDTLIIFFIDMI